MQLEKRDEGYNTERECFNQVTDITVSVHTKRRRGLGCRLRVNGEVVSDPQELLAIWVDHFGTLAQLRVGTEPELQELEHKVADLLSVIQERGDAP